jgi:hypothetical protein
VIVGIHISRAAGVLVLALASGLATVSSAAARESDQLFQRRPERLLIESSQRVSDGRKLQRDADTSLRRAEGSAGTSEEDRSGKAAEPGGESHARTGVAMEDSAAGLEAGAGR